MHLVPSFECVIRSRSPLRSFIPRSKGKATIETFPQDCAFLPGAGWRDGTTIYQVGYWNGFYWSSSADVQSRPYNVEFLTDKVCISEPGNKNNAFSIRLVADAI